MKMFFENLPWNRRANDCDLPPAGDAVLGTFGVEFGEPVLSRRNLRNADEA